MDKKGLGMNENNEEQFNAREDVHQDDEVIELSHFYVVTEVSDSGAYHITHIPSQCGQHAITVQDALGLYEGRSVERVGEEGLSVPYYIVRAGFDRKSGAKNFKEYGVYEMHLAVVHPCHDESTGATLGYISNNIFVPNKVNAKSADHETWAMNSSSAAALTYFGEFEDAYGRWVGIEDFEAVQLQAVSSLRPIDVQCDFLDLPRNNWHVHNSAQLQCIKHSKGRSIAEYAKLDLVGGRVELLMPELLSVDRVLACGKEFYQMWSASPNAWGYVVNIPAVVGGCRLTEKNVLELYDQRSTVVYHNPKEKNGWHYLVPFSIVEESRKNDFRKILLEGHVAKLREVFPCFDQSEKKIIGYTCDNIFIPKTIISTNAVLEIDERHAAQLASFGEMWDWTHSPVLKIADFPRISRHAATTGQQPVEVQFIACNNSQKQQNNEGRSLKL